MSDDRATRAYWHQLVLDCTPGPYEGEPEWTPYYWRLMMDGEGALVLPHESDSYVEFDLIGTLAGIAGVATFPELEGASSVRVYTSEESGHIRTEVVWPDSDEPIACYAVQWAEDGRIHRVLFSDQLDADAYRTTLPPSILMSTGAYVVSTSAPRRDVIVPTQEN